MNRSGFTLIEIMLASIAAALILAAIYGLFQRAIKMRDSATARIRDVRARTRAAGVIRNDLENALFSGGLLAADFEGGSTSSGGSGFPGYLKMTTTTGKDTTKEIYGDVQQVEYYITRDEGTANNAGTLVRVVTRDLLDAVPNVVHRERILQGVSSMQVSFYDGSEWQGSWMLGGTNAETTGTAAASGSSAAVLPVAVRVDIRQAPSSAPLEILVPWNTAPFLSGSNFAFGAAPQ